MPFYLEETDILSRVKGLRSVLIVPCRFCPAASLAVKKKKPYLEPFRRILRTESYESFIRTLKRRLEAEGITTAIFDAKLPHHFVACMWTSRRRRQLAARAAQFEGVVALGCDATVETVRLAIGDTDCRVIQGMVIKGGIMNVRPIVSPSLNVSLELKGITPVTVDGSTDFPEDNRPVVESVHE
jgi:hypothetical protein